MLTFNPIIVIGPAALVSAALLAYARLKLQKRSAEQMKPRPVPVSSRKRREPKDS